MKAASVPIELLRRYNVAGPRYTSYPTAPSWKESLDADGYSRILEESSAATAPAPLSLYFHLPFCERLCYFCGCTVVITGTHHGPEDAYLATIEREIDWAAQRLEPAAAGRADSEPQRAAADRSSSSTWAAARRRTSRRSC